jgi:type IV pilus assembly protein PilB
VQDTLGTRLVETGVITAEQLRHALRIQRESGGTLGQALLRLKFVPEMDLVDIASRVYNVKAVDLATYPIDVEAARLISAEVARRHLVLPVARNGRRITVAMATPNNVLAMQDITFVTGLEVDPVLSPESVLREVIERVYDVGEPVDSLLKDVGEELEIEGVEPQREETEGVDVAEANEAPIVRLVNSIIVAGVRRGASDIHLESYERRFRIRFRIDGDLQEVMSPPPRLRPAIVSRLKVMADLDIAERRIPQDGRIKIKVGKRAVDLRVSTLPTVYGEKIVLRILDRSNLSVDLTRAGFQHAALAAFLKGIRAPYGMVLVTGPTGSGKTTTLYSALTQLNQPGVNIMTAEDPVEYNLDGINQVHINEEVGLTFAAALRAFLRQDPNIVMIGEIRDAETGSIATKAALTGHLVLSTLHTNDAPSTITRLMDMGIEPFLVANSLNVIVTQRLVRRICTACREQVEVEPALAAELGLDGPVAAWSGRGCAACNGTGLRGRVGLFEVLPMTRAIRELILGKAPLTVIRQQAVADGMISLRADGLLKLQDGVTSAEEILKETALE